ncbi:MAG TPA: FtsX-like permease family protein [Candidatus Dormibacteraeota bacterium]|nr:FtsX-like permease family protein [Candidatus Dormibacteraeota bacterium]
MLVTDMFKLAAKALLDRKIRSVLTILGITVGSAIILALIASSSGLSAGITANIQKTGANILTIRNSGGFFASGSSNTYQLSQTDLTYLKSIPGVVQAYPYFSYSASIVNGGASLEASVVGIDLSALPILYNGLTVAEGTIPLSGDTTSAAIGWSIANPVSGTPIGLHQLVSMSLTGIKGAKSAVSYAVLASAILTQYGTALFSNIDDTVYISFQAATILSKTPYFNGIYVVVDNTADVANVQNTITTYYGSNVRVISPGQILSSIQGITGQLTVFLGSIGAVSLFVATVGIVNTMYVSVMERTREIGILKAIGYRPKQIMGMFLSEAALTGAVGGVTGLILGYALSFLMGGELAGSTISFGRGPGGGGGAAIVPVFSTELIIFALTFPVLLATVAGLYPAWRASRMNPVVALKYE